MKKNLSLLICLAVLSGCKTTTVQNFNNQSIPANLTNLQIEKAIQIAAANNLWIIDEQNDKHTKLTYTFANSIVMVVNITYANGVYSIDYVSSSELKYNPDDDSIDKSYNIKVNQLNQDIQKQLSVIKTKMV